MTNEELDHKVAELHGWKKEPDGRLWRSPDKHIYSGLPYRPSTNWQQAGELIEKYGISLEFHYIDGKKYWSTPNDSEMQYKPQKAICLAVLALEGENRRPNKQVDEVYETGFQDGLDAGFRGSKAASIELVEALEGLMESYVEIYAQWNPHEKPEYIKAQAAIDKYKESE